MRLLRGTASAAKVSACPSGAICRLLWRASAALALFRSSSSGNTGASVVPGVSRPNTRVTSNATWSSRGGMALVE
eukprot:3281139-Amphidinium_carterae.3